MLADDVRETGYGTRGGVVGRPEHGHSRDASRCGNVHRARVVGEEEAARGGEIDELTQGGLTGKVTDFERRTGESGGDVVTSCPVGCGSKDDCGARHRRKCKSGFGESLGVPSLGSSIRRAGADADGRNGRPKRGEVGQSGFAGSFEMIQADILRWRQVVDYARATQQLDIVKTLVTRDIAGVRQGNGMCQEKPTGVAAVADPLGNAGHPSEQGGIEGVLKKQRQVEPFGTQSSCEFALCPEFAGSVWNYAVGRTLASVEFGYLRAGDNNDLGVWEYAAKGA